jgi:hypothetical protein
VAGTHVAPRDARVTVSEWCATWLACYSSNRPNTVKSAKGDLRHVEAEFGHMTLSEIRPSQVKAWTAPVGGGGHDPHLCRRLAQPVSSQVP